jgi:hypothetical protein
MQVFTNIGKMMLDPREDDKHMVAQKAELVQYTYGRQLQLGG